MRNQPDEGEEELVELDVLALLHLVSVAEGVGVGRVETLLIEVARVAEEPHVDLALLALVEQEPGVGNVLGRPLLADGGAGSGSAGSPSVAPREARRPPRPRTSRRSRRPPRPPGRRSPRSCRAGRVPAPRTSPARLRARCRPGSEGAHRTRRRTRWSRKVGSPRP